jgi:hypothetical protein
MEYKAIDGTKLISNPNEPVVYVCDAMGIPDGIYESIETYGDSTTIGIQQIKITRSVSNGIMTTTVVESTEQELIDYKNSLIYE